MIDGWRLETNLWVTVVGLGVWEDVGEACVNVAVEIKFLAWIGVVDVFVIAGHVVHAIVN